LEQVIKSSGYHFHHGSRVFTKERQATINYSDGEDLESGLLMNLKNTEDLSTLSLELMEKCTDWFHSYHLSSARANLLRPFKHHLSGTVLELGAGCGAITRYLGECASSVVAVEGTLQRSLICSERTRDQPNVFVIQSELSELALPVRFDTVVVIGVLEYAALFSDSPDPHLAFLENAKRHLKPDGTLFLAIENKLGLKYFAGSPEDHVGVPMFGLEDKYEVNGVRTFSKKAITKIFRGMARNFVRIDLFPQAIALNFYLLNHNWRWRENLSADVL
jgi:2-polyprenyl-3-methyl-5-hydroxy-6-metoxy-1,4-benzoquinol methylase